MSLDIFSGWALLNMNFFAIFFTTLVALIHVGIMVLEMRFWNHPIGQQIFAMSPEMSAATAVLAMNQGLYNGILAAGLFWAIFTGLRGAKIFFLLSIIVAGIFGGLTAKASIIFVQSVPALIALIFVLIAPAPRRTIRSMEYRPE